MKVPISGDVLGVPVRRESSMSYGFPSRKGKAAYDAGMAARGPYAKGVAKRAEILDTALAVIDEHGYTGATVKQLAEAVGLSQNGLLHYFGSKDTLFLEIVRRHEKDVAAQVDPEHADFAANLAERILNAASDSTEKPGMSTLMLSLATAASEATHPAHDYMRSRYEVMREITTSVLTVLQTRGQFPADGDPAAAAALIASALDGLQMQWLYDPTVDVGGNLTYLMTALGIDGATETGLES
jgi:AcrR family transcriptional regulator